MQFIKNYAAILKKHGSISIALAIAIIASLWIYSGTWSNETDSANASAKIHIALAKVRTTNSVATDYQVKLSLSGETAPNRQVIIRAETSGSIVTIHGDLGEALQAKATLAKIAIDTRNAQLEQAKAYLTQTEIEYDAANRLAKKGFQSDIQKSKALAALANAKANLALAELDLTHTNISTPFAGVIEERFVEIGDFLKIGDQVASLMDLDPLLISLEISENDIDKINKGQQVSVTMHNGVMVAGILKRIAPISNARTRTFTSEIEIPNINYKFSAGLTAKVEMPLPIIKAHRISPAWLTLSDDGLVGVKAVSANGDKKVIFHPINILSDGKDAMWVTNLPETLSIITVGHEFVKDGVKVQVVN